MLSNLQASQRTYLSVLMIKTHTTSKHSISTATD